MVQIIFPLLTKYFSLQVRPRPRPPAAARCPAPRDSGPSDEEWSGRSQGRWRPPLRASVRRIFVYAGKKYLVFIKKYFRLPQWRAGHVRRQHGGGRARAPRPPRPRLLAHVLRPRLILRGVLRNLLGLGQLARQGQHRLR